jgi:hypothetical protein
MGNYSSRPVTQSSLDVARTDIVEKTDMATSCCEGLDQFDTLNQLTEELHNVETTPEMIECLRKFNAFLRETGAKYEDMAKRIDAKICEITGKDGKYNCVV